MEIDPGPTGAETAAAPGSPDGEIRPGAHGYLTKSRLRALRAALSLSWLGMGALGVVVMLSGRYAEPELYIPLIGLGTALLLVSVLRWRSLVDRRFGTILLFALFLVATTALVATAPYQDIREAALIGSLWIVVLAALLLPTMAYTVMALVAEAGLMGALLMQPDTPSLEILILYPVALAGMAVLAGITAYELRRQALAGVRRLGELEQQGADLLQREAELERLYEVSRTIGAGDDLAEVLPQLVGRTAGYVEAKVGLVLLYKPNERILQVLSPIWVAGQALDAPGYEFPLSSTSGPVRVFTNGKPLVLNSLTPSADEPDSLLSDLGVERVAAVPLRLEARTIGVLLVADKPSGFTDEDVAALELLAAPAALVLDNLARYEEAQEASRRMAELAQLKSDFVSVVSHELRTPLTSVIGALSTLIRPELAPDDPTAMGLLTSAQNQANRLRKLIEDLLTVSKIDNEAMPQRTEALDLPAFLTETIETISEWEGLVTMDTAPIIPAVAADRDHVRRIVTNLIDNARKYGGGPPIEVTIRSVDYEVWVSVADHGPGIPYEYHDRIFERFTQVERPETREKGGTGLGLNIVKELTESMGGRVWLEPTEGGGATFVVAFPRFDPELAS